MNHVIDATAIAVIRKWGGLVAWAAVIVAAGPACGGSTGATSPAAGSAPSPPRTPWVGKTIDGLDDVRCPDVPPGAAAGFRHLSSRLWAAVGDAAHRGHDVIASVDDPEQAVTGKLAYGDADKSLEDEDLELFACFATGWRAIGVARSDKHGRFALTLSGEARLPAGMRELFASVVADRSGTRFLAYVAPAATEVVVSDIDGTLTSSENAFPTSIVIGRKVTAHPGAADALRATGHVAIYTTARGDRFTDATRSWLDQHGFARGPLRLAPSLITPPGDPTVAYKTSVLRGLPRGFAVTTALGNRDSDVTAYLFAGVSPARIFVKLPEFADELGSALERRDAVGIDSYVGWSFDDHRER